MITIVNCNLSDAKLLFKIHNYSVAKGYLNSNTLVKSKDFKIWKKWLEMKLSTSQSKIIIGKIKDIKFGFVRFDRISKNVYEVSIGILAKYYNKSLGTLLLKKSVSKFVKTYKPKKIVCLIKKTNKRSESCFRKNNFKLVKFDTKKHKTHNMLNTYKDDYYEYTL